MNRCRVTLDVRVLNKYLNTLALHKISQKKNRMNNMLFTSLDLSQMFYSIRLTRRSQSFLCFYNLSDDKIYQFTRLVIGLKTAPFIATRSLHIVLNQKNFEAFIDTVEDKDLKVSLKQLKLETVLICYIDNLLLATPKSLGVGLHLALFEFFMEMMCQLGFKVNTKECSILCETITFLGVELKSRGYNGIHMERRNLLANVRTPRSLAELFFRICHFSYSSNYIPQFSKLVAPLRKIIKEKKFSWSKVGGDQNGCCFGLQESFCK